ncbi:MAG: SDR family NAD(P)-dependent oxidoreductase [Candidatus Binatus sp.]|uniref:SDR family NAD(P)-dependent oxidoreductase n=1 Tax=Candidatus Binatus sp. TaxID=2811406 RepID=UPI0027184B68|nr:SDR family NAD(P)-dependent oxidoreductase [Candidatus Binatus sp.]MDO8434017.1 SDR family NAD(P)-dependent oxidoreductase [Candidatus Binatus sp.]
MKLENKVAVITGGGSGMGKASALLFAAEGAKVAVVDLDERAAAETASEINSAGRQATAIRADVSKEKDAENMIAAAEKRFGTPTIIFNNAGIEGESAYISKMTEDAFDRVIAINLRGVFLGMKYVLPGMIKAGGGSIVNQASIAGMVAVRGGVAYCAAKAGVIAMTRVAALENARYNIRVNCICPGGIETAMAKRIRKGAPPDPKAVSRISVLNRMGQPEEIAKMALFLASDDASFATGAPFVVDGGWTIS